MANRASAWTKIDGGKSGNAVQHECIIVHDTSNTTHDLTPPFDWPMLGDITISVQPFAVSDTTATDTVTATTQDIDVDVVGSIEGGNDVTDWHIMKNFGSILTSSITIASGVYDMDAEGIMPKMCLSIGPDSGDTYTLRVVVTTHNMV
tara:strand:- start:989 stop:1432 length:444 start_codon:yes stop_codon:yes gene_type:complete